MEDDFKVVFDKVEELRSNQATADLVMTTEVVKAEGNAIAELMEAARDLEEPPPAFFTRS
jgi:hypothetical protein